MAHLKFEIHPSETILFQATPSKKWYSIIWKIFSGVAIVIILTFVLYSLLAGLTGRVLNSFLPTLYSGFITKGLFLGVIPLVIIAWAIEDVVCSVIGELILNLTRFFRHKVKGIE